MRLLRSMPAHGVTPNVVSFNAAIGACEKGEQWQLALGLLDEMPRRSIQPDSITYNQVIMACAAGQQWEMSLAMLREMPGRGMVPAATAYSSLIAACGHAQQGELALELRKEVEKNVALEAERARVAQPRLPQLREKLGPTAGQIAPLAKESVDKSHVTTMDERSVSGIRRWQPQQYLNRRSFGGVQSNGESLAPFRKAPQQKYNHNKKVKVHGSTQELCGFAVIAAFAIVSAFGWAELEDWLYWTALVLIAWFGWSGKIVKKLPAPFQAVPGVV
jgi:pentatricopeptide repeat protein